MNKKIVWDCNVFSAAYMKDDKWHEYGKAVINLANAENWKLHLPQLFFLEVEQVWLRALREDRLSKSDYSDLESLLFRKEKEAAFTVYPSQGWVDWKLHAETRRLANQHMLSFYDAHYLAVAKIANAVLITKDAKLMRAADLEDCFYDPIK